MSESLPILHSFGECLHSFNSDEIQGEFWRCEWCGNHINLSPDQKAEWVRYWGAVRHVLEEKGKKQEESKP